MKDDTPRFVKGDVLELDKAASQFAVEQRWIKDNRATYAGKWVALSGDTLIATGNTAKDVYIAAKSSGYTSPLVVRIEQETEPVLFGGW